MFIPFHYKGHARNFAGDIALIVTTKIFDLTINVRPICVIWDTTRCKALLDPTKTKSAYVYNHNWYLFEIRLSVSCRSAVGVILASSQTLPMFLKN